MPTEDDLVEFLADRMALTEVERFVARFGGDRVPKRSAALERQRNMRILVACLLRTVNGRTVLTEQAAKAVADEFGITTKAVQNRWYAWRGEGPTALEGGASTDQATDAKTFRY